MGKTSTIARLIQRFRTWPPNIEPVVLVALTLATASLWGFIKIADEVFEGETQAFDRWAILALRDPENAADPIGPSWFEEVARDATALGGIAWLTFTTGVIAIFLCLDHKVRMMVFMLVATLGGGVLSIGLKHYYHRPHPDLVPHLSHVTSSSFPSGHSMLSAVVYLTLGSLLAAVMPNRQLKVFVLAVASLLTLFVGISRVFLGVHYPTDVLAGWLAGLLWSLLCWLAARWLQLSGQVEKQPT